jgi:hypothetical protein
MVIPCPDCGQPLRFPDQLHNPLLRCPACKSTFRPLEIEETEAIVDETDAWQESEPDRPETEATVRSRPTATAQGRKKAGSGLGIIGLILFILIAQAPRLLKHVFDGRPQQRPAPRVNEKDVEQLKRFLDENERDLERMQRLADEQDERPKPEAEPRDPR